MRQERENAAVAQVVAQDDIEEQQESDGANDGRDAQWRSICKIHGKKRNLMVAGALTLLTVIVMLSVVLSTTGTNQATSQNDDPTPTQPTGDVTSLFIGQLGTLFMKVLALAWLSQASLSGAPVVTALVWIQGPKVLRVGTLTILGCLWSAFREPVRAQVMLLTFHALVCPWMKLLLRLLFHRK